MISPATPENIDRAAAVLRDGRLVAFPTETVYGLGGDALNDKAIAAIYAAKGRPQFNPLIVHVADAADLDPLVEWTETARLLAAQLWPGPLTLVLKRTISCPVSLLVSAGMPTLAVRVPSHPVARQLIRATGRPIAAPSANASGKLSPTTPLHVAESLGDKVDMILAAGKTTIGLESTVLDLFSKTPRILRPGGVGREQLEKVLGPLPPWTPEVETDRPASPGMLPSHYAPNLPIRLDATSVAADEALLAFGPAMISRNAARHLNLSERGDLDEAAANLFAMLHQLDKPEFSAIAVMPVPETGLGVAINDRLRRASVR
jgi:L-threonylcarbamoyladenylate synthase